MDIAELMDAWNRLDNAAQRVSVAIPRQLTEASADLEMERKRFRSVMQD